MLTHRDATLNIRTPWGAFFVVTLLVVSGCGAGDRDVRAVLSATIDWEVARGTAGTSSPGGGGQARGLAIRPSMRVWIPAAESFDSASTVHYIVDQLDGVPLPLVEELVVSVGRRTGSIEDIDVQRGPVILITERQEEQLVQDWRRLSPELTRILGAEWTALHFPTPPVIRNDRALAYFVINEFPPYAAEGRVAYLHRSDSGWTVEEVRPLWSEN